MPEAQLPGEEDNGGGMRMRGRALMLMIHWGQY